MTDWRATLKSAGFAPRRGATPDAISRAEAALGVSFPSELRGLYTASNGAGSDGLDVAALAHAGTYGNLFAPFGYAPFTDDSNDSNVYAVCCHEPLTGYVIYVPHDDEARLICRDLWRFFELVAEARDFDPDDADEDGFGPPDRLLGDYAFGTPERTDEDRAVARRLLELGRAAGPGEVAEYGPLRFAARLFGPGCIPTDAGLRGRQLCDAIRGSPPRRAGRVGRAPARGSRRLRVVARPARR